MMLRKCLFVILLTLVPLIKSEADSVLDREKRSDRLTAYACEDTTLNITCGPDLYLDVIRANYGRFSITICNVHGNTEWKVDCQAGRTLRAMQTRCSNKNQCIVPVQSSIFGDPCPGTYKYIEVHYTCRKEPIALKTSTSRPNLPSWTLPTDSWTPKAINSTLELSNGTNIEATTVNPDLYDQPQEVIVKSPIVSNGFIDAIRNQSKNHMLPIFTTEKGSTTSTTKRPLSIVVNNFTQYCPSDRSRGLAWNWTLAGETSVVQCPQGSTGFAKRSCEAPDDQDQRVHWTPKGPSLAECRSLWLGELETKLRSGALSVTNVSSLMSQNTHKSHIYGGDLVLGARMLKHMAEKMHYDLQQTVNLGTRESMVTELVQNVVKTASNLVSDSEQIRQSWGDLSQDELGRAATALLIGLEENAFLLAETVTSEKIIIKPTDNILLSIRVMQARNAHKQIFPSIETTDSWTSFGDTIELSPEAIIQNGNNGAVRVIFTAFNQLDQLLIPIKGKFGQEQTRRFINSRVIAASLGRGRHIELPKPVKITFRHLNDVDPGRVRPECVYWDYVSNAWLDDGCYAIMSNVTHTQCSCNHLTNFALLMSHSNANIAKNEIKMSPSKSDNKNKSSITAHISTIVVSVAALIVVAVIIFFAVIAWKKFKVSSQCRSALQNSGLPCFHKGKELPPDNAGNKGNFYTVTPKLYSNGSNGTNGQIEQEDVAEARQFFEHMINLQKNSEPPCRIQEKTNNLEQQKKMKQEGLYPKRSNLRALSPYNHIYMEIDGTETEQPVYEPLTHSETYLMSGMSDMSEDYVQTTTTDVSRQSSNRETRPLIRSISNEPRANLLQTISGVLHSQSVRIAPSGINGMNQGYGMNRAATLHPIRRNTQGGYSARFDMNTLARLNGNEMPLQVSSVNGNEFVRLNLNGQPEDANATYIASTTSDLGGQPATLMTSAYLRANAMQMQPMVQSMVQPVQSMTMGQPFQAMGPPQPVLPQQQQQVPQFASEI